MKKLLSLFIFFTITSGVALCQQKTTPSVTTDKNKLSTRNGDKQQIPAKINVPQNLPVTYTFTGDGNWNVPGNWTNNVVPPQPTNLGSEIIIDNISTGQCVLNIPYTVTPGTSFTILTGKTLLVTSLIVN